MQFWTLLFSNDFFPPPPSPFFFLLSENKRHIFLSKFRRKPLCFSDHLFMIYVWALNCHQQKLLTKPVQDLMWHQIRKSHIQFNLRIKSPCRKVRVSSFSSHRSSSKCWHYLAQNKLGHCSCLPCTHQWLIHELSPRGTPAMFLRWLVSQCIAAQWILQAPSEKKWTCCSPKMTSWSDLSCWSDFNLVWTDKIHITNGLLLLPFTTEMISGSLDRLII